MALHITTASGIVYDNREDDNLSDAQVTELLNNEITLSDSNMDVDEPERSNMDLQEVWDRGISPRNSYIAHTTSDIQPSDYWKPDSEPDATQSETGNPHVSSENEYDAEELDKHYNTTQKSDQSDHFSYFSASKSVKSYVSAKTSSTYYSASSEIGQKKHTQLERLQEDNEYSQLLKSKHLWPVDPKTELDWSGRGQHAEFKSHEKKTIASILEVQEVLGSTSTAIVQSVKCKRILLARKTIRCNRGFTKEKAIDEVKHLSKLSHPHVVQIIGTYVMGSELSILMYPVAEYNLESFIQDPGPVGHGQYEWYARISSLQRFSGCLLHAVQYLHSKMTKHMDIKPKNLLVRRVTNIYYMGFLNFKVYIADFGISRSYDTLEATETEGPTMFTRKYAAPEVVDRQKRGLSADVFSLGCVFVEIKAALSYLLSYSAIQERLLPYKSARRIPERDFDPLEGVKEVLSSNEYGDTSYQANIDAVCGFVGAAAIDKHFENDYVQIFEQIPRMLSKDPTNRPKVEALCSRIQLRSCCEGSADLLEAAPEEPTQESNMSEYE